MSTHLKPDGSHFPTLADDPERRRSPFRNRLIEAERGISQGLRDDSVFFVHFFLLSLVIASGLALGIGPHQWGIITLAVTVVLAAEMFNKALRAICEDIGHHFPESAAEAMRIATAGVFITIIGASSSVIGIFAWRLWEMLAD